MFQSRTQRQDGKYTCIYVYIFKQIFVKKKMSTLKKYVFHINIHISVFAMRG